jgi:carboxymethylenebutenolidase
MTHYGACETVAMCFGDDARPPAPPVRGPVGDHGDLVLTSADGTQFAAYHAQPAEGSGQAIVILPDVRGLHTFYKELAERFAEAGLRAVAIDYFGRTAGLTGRDEDFAFREHIEATTPAQIAADTAAGMAWLREQAGVRSMYTVGFCFGGSNSWAQSAAGHDLSGSIGFYGVPSRVADLVPLMRSPLLMLAAGEDFTPVEAVEAFAGQARAQGVEVDLTVFPGAPHSFFDRSYGEHQDACDQSWRLMLDFVARHSTQD